MTEEILAINCIRYFRQALFVSVCLLACAVLWDPWVLLSALAVGVPVFRLGVAMGQLGEMRRKNSFVQ